MAEGMTHLNNEWFNGRFAHAMSFLCQNIREADDILARMQPPESTGLKAVGLYPLAAFFKSKKGADFKEAAMKLNFYNEGDHDEESIREGAKIIFTHLRKLEKDMRRTAVSSAKLLAFAVQGLETLAALEFREMWVDGLHTQANYHNEEVMHFVRSPKDDAALLDAIVSTYADYYENKQSGITHSVFDDEGDNARAANASRTSTSGRRLQRRDEGSDCDVLPGDRNLFGGRRRRTEKKPTRGQNSLFVDEEKKDGGKVRKRKADGEGSRKRKTAAASGRRREEDSESPSEQPAESDASYSRDSASGSENESSDDDDEPKKDNVLTQVLDTWTPEAVSAAASQAKLWEAKLEKGEKVKHSEMLEQVASFPEVAKKHTKIGALHEGIKDKDRLSSAQKKTVIATILSETAKLLSHAKPLISGADVKSEGVISENAKREGVAPEAPGDGAQRRRKRSAEEKPEPDKDKRKPA